MIKIGKLLFENTFLKWIVIPTIFISVWFFAAILVNPYASFTAIIYEHPVTSFVTYHQGMLLKGQHVTGIFKAEENNLGIIGVRIRGGVSTNPDDQESVRFTLQQANNSEIIYSNTYSVGTIREKDYLTFGFPKISDSKGKTYEFTLESLNGDKTNSLDLHKEEDFFISKYIYPGKLVRSPKAFLSLFVERVRMLFSNTEALLVSSIYFLPFLFYITLIGFSKTFKSKLGSLTLSLIVLSIIFIQGEYAGVTFGLFGLWIIAVFKDKVSYRYTLLASLGFFLFAALFVVFPKTNLINSSSLWGYLLLVVGFVQLVLTEINVKKNFKKSYFSFIKYSTKKTTKIDISYEIGDKDDVSLLPFVAKGSVIQKLIPHFFFLSSTFVLLLPILLTPHVVKANDLNGTDLYQIYFRTAVRQFHTFPQWNPYMQQGIPLIADPMYSMYNPVMSLPIIFMPTYDFAIKLIYVLSLFFACETMFLLTKEFTRSTKISFFIALMYATSGYAAARLTAGHIESFVPYCIIPFLIFSLYKVVTKTNLFWSGINALVFTYILFSGSVYFLLYGCYCVLGLLIYYIFKDRKVFFFLCLSLTFFILFSSIKIIPILELQNSLGKTKEPFLGSQTVVSMVRYLFIPFDAPFLLLHLSSLLSPAWAELEKISFIGIFPFLGFLWFLKNFRRINIAAKPFLIILFAICFLILMPGWLFNPFHWLIQTISSLQFFRVPSRAFAFFIVIILLLFGISMRLISKNRNFKRFILPVLIINLISTIVFFEVLLIKPAAIAYPILPANLSMYEKIFSWLEEHNTNNTYVLAEIWPNEVPEDIAFYHHQRLLNTNYGFVLKDSPAAEFANVVRPSPFAYAVNYTDIQPGYFIAPHDQVENIPPFAKKVYKTEDTAIYQLPAGRPFADLESTTGKNTAVSAVTGLDSFTVTTTSLGGKILSLAEMAYPGWSVTIDGKKAIMQKGRFLEVKTLPGNHTYVFSFASVPYQIGLVISLFSLFLWTIYASFFVKRHYLKN